MDDGLRVCFVGGVPTTMGGGGLERQMSSTAEALRERGHRVFRADDPEADKGWDVAHAFGSEGIVQATIDHWVHNPSPLVISPVLSVSPGLAEHALVALAHLPAPRTQQRSRRLLLRRADLLVALTEEERRVVDRVTGGRPRVAVVPNGVEALFRDRSTRSRSHVLMLGEVNPNKRQVDVLEAMPDGTPVVVAGAVSPEVDTGRWQRCLARPDVDHRGVLRDRETIAALLRSAEALVQMSRQEVQSLSVLEALACGTPVVLSDIPAHRDLERRFPAWVALASGPAQVPERLAELRHRTFPDLPPAVPSWEDVAGQLEALYRGVLDGAA